MRMWNLNVKKMCRVHLLGEHGELHMMVSNIKDKKSIQGFLDKRFIEPLLIKQRHKEVSEEMIRRGYNHRSPLQLDVKDLFYLGEDVQVKVNKGQSLIDLKQRCERCKI